MHDPVYREAIAWQNTAYNQPLHLGFYHRRRTQQCEVARHHAGECAIGHSY